MQIIGTEVLSNLLHLISNSLLIPVMIILVVVVFYTFLILGSFITEFYSRKDFGSKNTESLMNSLDTARSPDEMKEIVKSSELQRTEKDILYTVINNHNLGSESREALAVNLIEEEELRLSNITTKSDVIVRLAPTLGLLGTLIPLGPGLSALKTGDIATLANALMIAFDTTVAGLLASSLAYMVSKYRKKWYTKDLSDLEAILNSTLEVLRK